MWADHRFDALVKCQIMWLCGSAHDSNLTRISHRRRLYRMVWCCGFQQQSTSSVFSQTVNSPWLTILLLFAVQFFPPVTAQMYQTVIDTSNQLQQRQWCMLLLPVAQTTVINFFVRVSGWLLDKLQSLQNAAAHLVTGARKCDHITPMIRDLHWLPVWQRLRFNTSFLVFNCLCGLAPVYLVDCCKPTSANSGCSHLRSANLCQLSVPRTSTSYGDRSFAVCGPSTGTVYLQRCDCDQLMSLLRLLEHS